MVDSAFLERVHALQQMVYAAALPDDVEVQMLSVLGALVDFEHSRPEQLAAIGNLATLYDAIDDELSRLPGLLQEPDNTNLLAWARRAIRILRSHFKLLPLTSSVEADDRDRLIRGLDQQDQRLALVIDDANFRKKAERLIEDIEATASEAQQLAVVAGKAAGTVGEAELAMHFSKYASAELRSANIFRWLSVAAVGIALALALLGERPPEDDWVALVYRFAQFAGIAALAAYFGRQAAQHRRIYNWAKGLQIQLQSFPAFLAPLIDSATRDEVYRDFGRRVLGSPPERTTNSADEGYPSAQVVDLITAVLKKQA